jgi:hypothetical protein
MEGPQNKAGYTGVPGSAGLNGILVRRTTEARFVISVDLIRRAIELNQADLMMAP